MKAFAVLAAVVAALSCLPAHAASSRKNALEIVNMTNPAFPQHLLQRGILHGEVEVIVSISPEGRTADWLVTAYTDQAFEKMAAEILPGMEYRLPASSDRTGPSRARLRFYFETRGVVVSQSINDTIDNLISRISGSNRIDKMGTPRQLDRRLIAQHTVAPRYPESPQDSSGARVTLEFLIDETGRVRMPVLHEGENRLLANAAATALLDWQFNPPTRNGRPVIVSARQEFVLPPRL